MISHVFTTGFLHFLDIYLCYWSLQCVSFVTTHVFAFGHHKCIRMETLVTILILASGLHSKVALAI